MRRLLISGLLVALFAGLTGCGSSGESADTSASDDPVVSEPSGGDEKRAPSGDACSATPLADPVDLATVTAVLWPGQTRNGDYKGHGGFLFRGVAPDDVAVRTPIAGRAVQGARYVEIGELQHLVDIETDCGIRIRFDHLRAVGPKLTAAFDALPAAKPDDSRTTRFDEAVELEVGDLVAQGVGFTVNTAVDFGVYEGDTPVCWFDLLSAASEAKVRSLPPGDQQQGTTSDVCNP